MSPSKIIISKKRKNMMAKGIARSTFLSTLMLPTSNQMHILYEKFKKEPHGKGAVYLDAIQAICDHRANQTAKEKHEPGIFIHFVRLFEF